jgi:hypothetical protein
MTSTAMRSNMNPPETTDRSGHTVGRWGIGIKRDDGTVSVEPDSWED